MVLYAVLGLIGCVAAFFAVSQRTPFEANLLRLRDAPPFVVDNGRVRNAFEVHIVNKQGHDTVFELRGRTQGKLSFTIALPTLKLAELRDQRVPVFIEFAQGAAKSGDSAEIELLMDGQQVRVLRAPLLAPIQR
jgi:hypothetical protein